MARSNVMLMLGKLGHLVGIVANQTPVINPDEALKGTQFIRMCNQQ